MVTKKKLINEEKLAENIADFRSLVLEKSESFSHQNIWNADQIAVCYELHRMRTLSDQGEKLTVLMVQRENSTTHSVTVMPLINGAGKFGKLYVCLNETSNVFGPIVQKSINELEKVFPFLKLVCSTSGKLSTNLMKTWSNQVLTPTLNECNQQFEDNLLLLDSWGGHWGTTVWDGIKNVHREKIPEGATGKVQPLDVGVNSYYKQIIKRITDFIILEEIDCIIGIRENIVKLICLSFNQLSAEVFVPLLKFSWKKAGLLKMEKQKFSAPKDVLFKKRHLYCDMIGCQKISLIRCGHCFESLCFSHFFEANHIHL